MKDHCIDPRIKCKDEDCETCIWPVVYGNNEHEKMLLELIKKRVGLI